MNSKFLFFLCFFIAIDTSHSVANLNSTNVVEIIQSPNVILNLIASIYVGSAFRKGKEKDCEEIVPCLSKNPIEHVVSELKKKKFKKIEWKINKVCQDRWVARLIWFELICEGMARSK
jgi:hypothetical protein